MGPPRLTDSERLDLLAAAVLDYLDDTYSEGELDNDAGPPRTVLYNLANVVLDRYETAHVTPLRGAKPDQQADADAELVRLAEEGLGDTTARLEHVWREVQKRADEARARGL